jgi:hypothetical protein
MSEDLSFYLGTHRPAWLWRVQDIPMFISHRVLRERKTPFPRATTTWALDSGGFTELNLYGEWRTTPEEYVTYVRRYVEELGSLQWASPQDWMCEPWVIEKTGLSVAEHQERTITNYLTLRELAPDLPFIPVLQGWDMDDYHRHAEAYAAAGVDLATAPTVGIGSVCRRQATGQITAIFDALHARGLRMHGFGVKTAGLTQYADALVSADSLAWSYWARRDANKGIRHCPKKTCANCLHYALDWRARLLRTVEGRQLSLFTA